MLDMEIQPSSSEEISIRNEAPVKDLVSRPRVNLYVHPRAGKGIQYSHRLVSKGLFAEM